jgi:hypothetical protein
LPKPVGNKSGVSRLAFRDVPSKALQHLADNLTGQFSIARDHGRPAPGIHGQLIQVLNPPGSQRIDVNVAHQFEKIVFFIADKGFVAILKLQECPFHRPAKYV